MHTHKDSLSSSVQVTKPLVTVDRIPLMSVKTGKSHGNLVRRVSLLRNRQFSPEFLIPDVKEIIALSNVPSSQLEGQLDSHVEVEDSKIKVPCFGLTSRNTHATNEIRRTNTVCKY